MRRTSLAFVLLVACAGASPAGVPAAATPPASAASALPAAAASAGAAPPAATTPAPAASITTLESVDVTGVVPGPGLWKVSRGDHVLWVLGVVPTLPAGVRWQPTQVERAIADSQAVLDEPGVTLKLDTNWFGKLFLLPSVYKAQRNADGKTLAEVLPADVYARWETAKQKYFGDDRGIERYRPIFAAGKLLKQALKANNLRGDGEIGEAVAALAKQHGVKLVKPETTVEIKEPRQAVKAFAAEGPDGIACLALVLDVVDHELPSLRARANAWATGDIDTLRKVPESPYRETCQSAVMGAGFAKALGIDNLPRRVEDDWLAAADATLAAHPQSFALLPMHAVLDAHGYLAALQARGYTVTAPDADAPAGNASAPSAGDAAGTPASATSTH